MLGSGMHACLSLCRADVWCSFELSGTPFRSFFLRSAYKMIRCVSRSIHSWVRHIMQIIELGK